MSGYPIRGISADAADSQAIIGYDQPLQAHFLQAFEDQAIDQLDLWLGTEFSALLELAGLIATAEARGYPLQGLGEQIVLGMARDAGHPPVRSPDERRNRSSF